MKADTTKMLLASIFLVATLSVNVGAFSTSSCCRCSPRGLRHDNTWLLRSLPNEHDLEHTDESAVSRRTFVQIATLLTTSTTLSSSASAAGTPICVIGANGRTGTRCVEACVERGIPVRATSRLGVYNDLDVVDNNKGLVTPMVCDVTLPDTIANAVQGSRAVIFVASASKEGGKPSQVDNAGLVNVAKATIAAKVPHLVIVSSGGVSKPDSSVYKFLNLFGNIMAEKIKGEDSVRDMYKSSQSMTYTIVRPGGLTEEPGKGVSYIELNQGDLKTGRISRSDVASICIEATNYPQLAGKATFECYNADTGKSLNAAGMSNIMKQNSETSDVTSGLERRGDSWEAIFTGLRQD